tara:strand:+ start:4928 stop:5344 length:417 start_codon:yes stop_codon:yes gene_type:complete
MTNDEIKKTVDCTSEGEISMTNDEIKKTREARIDQIIKGASVNRRNPKKEIIDPIKEIIDQQYVFEPEDIDLEDIDLKASLKALIERQVKAAEKGAQALNDMVGLVFFLTEIADEIPKGKSEEKKWVTCPDCGEEFIG